jgi:hypothetical protein
MTQERSVAPRRGPYAPVSTILVRVKPGRRERRFEALSDGSFVATLRSPPVDGKANAELIALVAEHFKVPRAMVAIKSGAGARSKWVTVAGSSAVPGG